jgi:predicted sulfurtransferase
MMKKVVLLASLLVFPLADVILGTVATAGDVPRMTREQLKEKIGDPNLVVLDVRKAKDWEGSQAKIQGAMRQDPQKVEEWAKSLDKTKSYVLYCA